MVINNNPKKILAVHTGGIGDIVMLGPSLRLLRDTVAEGTTIDLLVTPMAREIAERNPDISNIICLDTVSLKTEFMNFRKILKSLKILFELRKKRYDIAIIFQPILSLLSMFRLLFFMTIIRPSRSFGRNTSGRGFFLSKTIQENKRDRTHEIYRMVEVMRISHDKKHNPTPHVFVLPKERERASQLLRENGICETDNFIVIASGSGKKTKEWVSARWIEFGDALTGFYDIKIVMVGGSKDDVLSKRIAASMAIKPVNFTGKISLFETAAIIEKAKVFIGNDSGLMHMAAAMGTYVIALFGPGDINRIRPFCSAGRYKIVTHNLPCAPCYKRTCASHKCMESITVNDILMEFDKMLINSFLRKSEQNKESISGTY